MSTTHQTKTASAWHMPTRTTAGWHAFKVALHITRRALRNTINGPRRWSSSNQLADAPVIVERHSRLWEDGREDEFLLRAGKVHNLRLAVSAFNGVVLPAGQTLSFWAQLGRMSRRRGFALGREIIAGCVVPTIGGGICQLSNALAQAAVATGIALPEWHRHSARIEQGSAMDIDATVAWNYIDLRLCSPFTVRIEFELSASELILRLRATDAPATLSSPSLRTIPLKNLPSRTLPVARGCLSCGETACFRHQPQDRNTQARRAIILGDYIPELADWLNQSTDTQSDDWLLGWERRARREWQPSSDASSIQWLWMPTLKRMGHSAWQYASGHKQGEGGTRQRNLHRHRENLARAFARHLRPEHLNLILTQDLLVPLWRSGALAGRHFDVWVDALPADEIQRRLDAAAQHASVATSLNDFRVDAGWLHDENTALFAARVLHTAHAEVARILRGRGLHVEQHSWQIPKVPAINKKTRIATQSPTLLFPASALPRKGAAWVAQTARQLDANVLILGTPPAHAHTGIWHGVRWRSARYADPTIWSEIDVVLLPALIEHRPHTLLQALALGIPVIATPACGLPAQPGLTLVEPDDPQALLIATRAALENMAQSPPSCMPL